MGAEKERKGRGSRGSEDGVVEVILHMHTACTCNFRVYTLLSFITTSTQGPSH